MKRKRLLSMAAALIAATLLLAAGCAGTIPVNAQVNNGAVSDSAKALLTTGDQNAAAAEGITVSGQGTVTIKPDLATITLGVESTDASAAKARTANDETMTKVLAALKTAGVAEADVATTGYNLYPRYDENGQKITGYTASNTVQVKVKNLDKLGDVLTAASAAGANTAGGISFDVADRTAAYNQALAQAMEKAKARAEVVATATGVKLGQALTISESSTYSGPSYEAAEAVRGAGAADMAVPVSSGQMDVTASVNVVYEIVK